MKFGVFYSLELFAREVMHPNEDIVRLTSEELKAQMAAKERAMTGDS